MYDNGGNITEEKVYDTSGATPVLTATNTYTYGDNSWGDLLTEYNGDTITYDEIGNPLQYRDGISFTWSNGRQLQSYTKNNEKAMFETNFDLNNNMSKFITLTPTGHNKVLYTYGDDNLLTGMTLNNHKSLNFAYDGISRTTSHTVNLILPMTTTYTYHGITGGGTVYKNNLIRTEK